MKFLENKFKGQFEKIVDYLKEFAETDAVFKEKLENSEQELSDFTGYIMNEAKKLADGAKSVMVEDKQVFGWAVHFIDENIDFKAPVEKAKKAKKEPVKEVEKAIVKVEKEPKKKVNDNQVSIFDLGLL